MAKQSKAICLGQLQDTYNDNVSFHRKCKTLLHKAQAALDAAQDNYNKAEVAVEKARAAMLNGVRNVSQNQS